jgi:hypothetical protein
MDNLLRRICPIVSNLIYVLVSARCLEYGYGLRTFLFFSVGLWTSPLYHLCMGFPATCFWSVYKYHVIDFWTAELSMPLAALLFVRFRAPFVEKWIIGTMVKQSLAVSLQNISNKHSGKCFGSLFFFSF